MATLADVCDAIETVLAAAGIRCYPYPVDDLAPPAVIVGIDSGEVLTEGIEVASYVFSFTAVAQAVSTTAGALAVYELADLTSTGGLNRTLFGNPDLDLSGVNVGDLRLTGTGSVDTADGRRYASASFEVPILISGAT